MNQNLSDKKYLYHNFKNYCKIFKLNYSDFLPITFHIQNGICDPEYMSFVQYFNENQ